MEKEWSACLFSRPYYLIVFVLSTVPASPSQCLGKKYRKNIRSREFIQSWWHAWVVLVVRKSDSSNTTTKWTDPVSFETRYPEVDPHVNSKPNQSFRRRIFIHQSFPASGLETSKRNRNKRTFPYEDHKKKIAWIGTQVLALADYRCYLLSFPSYFWTEGHCI